MYILYFMIIVLCCAIDDVHLAKIYKKLHIHNKTLTMSYTYISFHFEIDPVFPGAEILMAQLSEKPFDTFEETETGLIAYIRQEDVTENLLEEVDILQSEDFKISFTQNIIPAVNWNETWEKNFEPIRIDERCRIRAPFHEYEDVAFDIIIEPKMSFGTGHHETTHMMSTFLLDMNLENKKTLDMGCGTSILAILAAKKGAKPVDAIDIDPWCVENSIENIERNDCSFIRVLEGIAEHIPESDYDVIIANINRNILLEDMGAYANALKSGGILLLSGFYESDIEDISQKCDDLGFSFLEKRLRNQWASLKFEKK